MANCVVCGKVRVPNPDQGDNWHIIESQRGLFAVCPQHAPPDSATREQRRQAYISILSKMWAGPSISIKNEDK